MPEPSGPNVPAPSLDGMLLFRLSRLLGVAGGMVIRLCEGRFGITRREWRVLAALAHGGDLQSSELAARTQLDRARTSKAVTSLCGKGLLHRDPRPDDRRRVRLRLTEQGNALYAALFPLVADINRQLQAGLTALEREQLDRTLAALQHTAELLAVHATLPKAHRKRRPVDGG